MLRAVKTYYTDLVLPPTREAEDQVEDDEGCVQPESEGIYRPLSLASHVRSGHPPRGWT